MAKPVVNVEIGGDASGLKRALGDAEKDVGGFGSKLGGLLKGGAAVAGVAAGAALTKGFVDALDAEAGVDRLQASLGISESAAAELGNAAANVYRDAWGGSLSEVQATVGNLSSSFEGLGGDQVETLTSQALALGDAFGIDAAAGIQTASELVSSGLAGSAEEAFDLLTAGLQEMPAGIRDELLAASNEYGDFFADLGISGEEGFALLTAAADGGVYGIDKVGDALKEVTIRGADMSTSSIAAFEAAGLNAEEMAAAFAEGGDSARAGLDKTVEGLQGIEDPVERANAAIALFGTPLEDLSVSEIPAFLDSLANMGDGLGDIDGAAQEMADALGGNTSAKIESFKRKALGGLADFAADKLIPAFEFLVEWGERNWPKFRDAAEEVVDWFRDNVEPILRDVFDGVVAAATTVVDFFRDNWDTISNTVETAFDWIVENRDLIIGAFVGIAAVLLYQMVPAWTASTIAAAGAAVAFVAANAPIVAITALIAGLAAGLVWAYQNVEWFRDIVDRARDLLATGFRKAVELGKVAIDKMSGAIDAVSEWLQTAWDRTEGLRSLIATGLIKYVDLVKRSFDLWWSALQTAASWLQTAWDKSETLRSLMAGAFKRGIDIAKDAIDLAWGAVETLVTWLGDAWTDSEALRELLANAFKRGIDAGRDAIDLAWGAVETLADWLQTAWDKSDTLRSLFVGAFKAAVEGIKGAFDLVKRGIDPVVTAIGRVTDAAKTAIDWVNKIPGINIGGGRSIEGNTSTITGNRPVMHDGGFVGNPNGPAIDIPIVAQQGEMVLSRSQVRDLMASNGPEALARFDSEARGELTTRTRRRIDLTGVQIDAAWWSITNNASLVWDAITEKVEAAWSTIVELTQGGADEVVEVIGAIADDVDFEPLYADFVKWADEMSAYWGGLTFDAPSMSGGSSPGSRTPTNDGGGLTSIDGLATGGSFAERSTAPAAVAIARPDGLRVATSSEPSMEWTTAVADRMGREVVRVIRRAERGAP